VGWRDICSSERKHRFEHKVESIKNAQDDVFAVLSIRAWSFDMVERFICGYGAQVSRRETNHWLYLAHDFELNHQSSGF
jgi:hypothetical protein